MTSIRTLLTAAATTLVVAAPAAADVSYDTFDAVALNTEPHATSAIFDAETPVFDTSAYTTQLGEKFGCSRGGGIDSLGTKTAWVKFRTAVAGSADITAASDHDVIVSARIAAPGSAARLTTLQHRTCIDAHRDGAPNEHLADVPLNAGETLFVQVLAACGTGPQDLTGSMNVHCDETQEAMTPGGKASVHLTFDPAPGAPDPKPQPEPDPEPDANPNPNPNPGPQPEPQVQQPTVEDQPRAGGDLGPQVRDDGYQPIPADTPSGGGMYPQPDPTVTDPYMPGVEAPLPALEADVEAKWAKRFSQLSLLRIAARKGARIEVACIGKRCPKTFRGTVATRGITTLKRPFGKRRFKPGTIVEIRVSLDGTTPTTLRFKVRKGRRPSLERQG
jgi:hypothetical protein